MIICQNKELSYRTSGNGEETTKDRATNRTMEKQGMDMEKKRHLSIKRSLTAVLLVILLMTGCADVGSYAAGQAGKNGTDAETARTEITKEQEQTAGTKEKLEQSSETDGQTEVLLFDSMSDTAVIVDLSSPAVCAEQYYMPEDVANICAGEDMIFYTTTYDNICQICGVNRKTKETMVIDEVSTGVRYLTTMEAVGKEVYVLWRYRDDVGGSSLFGCEYREDVYRVEDGDVKRRRINQTLFHEMDNKNFTLIESRYTPEYNMREFGGIYAYNRDTNTIGILDGKGKCRETMEAPDDMSSFTGVANGYVLCYIAGGNRVIYRLDTGKIQTLPDATSILKCSENAVYYYRSEMIATNIWKRSIYLYDIETETEKMLYAVSELPGDRFSKIAGTRGFRADGAYCWFIGTDGVDGAWYVYDPTIDEMKPIEGAQPLWHCSYADYGTVVSGSKNAICSFCGKAICWVYAERFVLDNDIPNADKINAYLEEEYKKTLALVEKYETDVEEDEWHLSEGFKSGYDDIYLSEVKIIGLHYLQVFYSTEWYGGGAHGMPGRRYELFDLNTGEHVTIADLYEGDEEAFREIVAEYTVLDWKEDNSQYYSQSEEEVYKAAYASAGFSMDVEFTDDGIVAVYGPYVLGSYAAGFIEVEIPYEALHMEAVKGR